MLSFKKHTHYLHPAHRHHRERRRRIWRQVLLGVTAVVIFMAGGISAFLLHHPKTPGSKTGSARSDLQSLSPSNGNYFGIAAGGAVAYQSPDQVYRYMKGLKELGVSWVRFDFDWNDIQRTDARTYNWAKYDVMVDAAHKEGLRILGIVTYTPAWARPAGCLASTCPPADPLLFGAFCGMVAERYSTKGVSHWEIWNEPNISTPAVPSSSYAVMLRSASTNIKAADPTATVLFAGLGTRQERSGAIAPEQYLQEVYQAGLVRYFDAVSLHPYTYPSLAGSAQLFIKQIEEVRTVMRGYEDADKPIWITEFGAPTGEADPSASGAHASEARGRYVSEDHQAAFLTQAADAYAQLTYKGPFFWFNYQDTITKHSDKVESFFGLLRADGSRKPSYDAYQQVITQLGTR